MLVNPLPKGEVSETAGFEVVGGEARSRGWRDIKQRWRLMLD